MCKAIYYSVSEMDFSFFGFSRVSIAWGNTPVQAELCKLLYVKDFAELIMSLVIDVSTWFHTIFVGFTRFKRLEIYELSASLPINLTVTGYLIYSNKRTFQTAKISVFAIILRLCGEPNRYDVAD